MKSFISSAPEIFVQGSVQGCSCSCCRALSRRTRWWGTRATPTASFTLPHHRHRHPCHQRHDDRNNAPAAQPTYLPLPTGPRPRDAGRPADLGFGPCDTQQSVPRKAAVVGHGYFPSSGAGLTRYSPFGLVPLHIVIHPHHPRRTAAGGPGQRPDEAINIIHVPEGPDLAVGPVALHDGWQGQPAVPGTHTGRRIRVPITETTGPRGSARRPQPYRHP